ncbi:LuxR family transcriptional regulator [Bradyrhizobium sediminis]|uniref:LuxR family transcriptional regulator n=1 Tax=Bradyrhizobium sediminis TaxID=2840469 RepID=A0A975NUE6_9BRAD|nr:LuxR C-terminal-related transcriptional regulator [Bradyrhizobium sediminis]QWG21563.1 LuxR family transcriptional regulator [Bradyrhizobium sediminis]
MDQTEQLSKLISEIYDAALDPSLWEHVVGKAGRFVGGPAASIFSKSPISGEGNVHYESGIGPHYWELYCGKYVKLDPTTTGHYFADVGQPIAVADLMPYDQFLDTRIYKEWVQPQGLVDFVSAVLDKSMTTAAFFGVFRHERDGIADADTRRRMRLIVPHVRRALLVGRLIDLKSAEVATFADTLDGLNTGICLVDSSGRIVHANLACHVILDAGDPLFAIAGRIAARDAQTHHFLLQLFAAAGDGDAAMGTQGIALPLTGQDGTRYVIHVLPLTSGARRITGIAYAAAAVFIRRVAFEALSPPEVIARTYKLTPTELRVLLAIVEVGGVPEVAAALGVGETTIKTHLRRLFGKTGANRQADLVKVVAGFSSPLISQRM